MAYPTLAQLKTHMGITGSSLDTVLTFALNAAIATTERYCNRSFILESAATKYFRVMPPLVVGNELLFFRDIDEITTVVNGDGVTVASSDYGTIPENDGPFYGIYLLPSSGLVWNAGGNSGRIAITGNWNVDTPSDIFWAVMEFAKFTYEASLTAGGVPAAGTSRQSGLTVLPEGLPDGVRSILDLHRRVVV